MVSIDLISDLHLDMYYTEQESIDFINSLRVSGNILVIAGDLCEYNYLIPSWIKAFSDKWRHIVYVPGNHEYYGSYFNTPINVADNWYVLNRRVILLEGISIAGATGWFPNTPDNIFYEHYLNDFAQIIDFKPAVYEEYERTKEFFTESSADIYVTHHLPFAESIHPKYRRFHDTNRFFYSEFESTVEKDKKPQYWLHGHTHIPMSYEYDGIKVRCNPRGYSGENSGEYQPLSISL